MKERGETAIILDNIRSVHNVGSIFRTADCAGVSEIYLCGATPTPVDRFGRQRKDFQKVSLGAEKSVRWQYKKNIADAAGELKARGFFIVSVEQSEDSESFKNFQPKNKTVFIFGHEVNGVSKEALALSDSVVEIPMKGKKESLNVSVCAGIVLFLAGLSSRSNNL